MNPSEELMLLLELNGFDITKFKLKKQLEYEKTGNMELYKYKKFQDLIVSHYQYEPDDDIFHRNPLTYRSSWPAEATSIDQFFVKHPDLQREMTLQEFLLMDTFDPIHRESILYDILDGWVEEYREMSIRQMENLKEMISRFPKKNKKYKKASKIFFLFAVLMAVLGMMLMVSPDSLKSPFLGFITPFIEYYEELLIQYWWMALIANFGILLFVLFAVSNNFFSRYMRDIRSEKSKHAIKTFDKWDQDMKDARLKQAGYLEDYVERVIKKPQKSVLELSKLEEPEIWLQRLKDYVQMIERKYDIMTKYYKTFRRALRWMYVFAVLAYVAFIGLGILMQMGWLSV
ncbi:hypothetical protein [Candidatus Xianfuyuplasma coldseepsis]|uniref:ABC transporter ATP-binding protein n=1 Tax=Candidatus Xianfuyuplasma coldseepsis TaxID=2782163 RepID=A0A7L7KSY8_9MOLU|nr:hypothetical protein [Xianfuyuplasma coldseepsis]QMS84888.1 ABC transporter ATP-binding protein [Xianfuyuplasma coldseepsis]